MTAWAAFQASLDAAEPPAGTGLALAALWWDAQGNAIGDAKGAWDRAHACAQEDPTPAGAAVHAYLHRKEGDLSNARYWYARAGREPASGALEAEWEGLARGLVSQEEAT